MTTKIKLTGIEIDFEAVNSFEELYSGAIKEIKVTMKARLYIFIPGSECSSFLSQYHAIKYGKNEQESNSKAKQ